MSRSRVGKEFPSLHSSTMAAMLIAITASISSAATDSWTQGGGNAGQSSYVAGQFDASLLELAWNVDLNFSQSGTGSWRQRAVATDGEQVYRVALEGYAPAGDYHVMAFDLETGAQAWDTVLQGRAFAGVGEPTVTDGKVWVNRAGHSGISGGTSFDLPRLYALSSQTGDIHSSTTYAAQHGTNDRPSTDGVILTSQAGYYGGFASYRVSDGSEVWWLRDASVAIITDDYLLSSHGDVMSRSTGLIIDEVTHPDWPNLNIPRKSPDGPILYSVFNSPDRGVAAFDPETLLPMWDREVDTLPRAVASGGGLAAIVTTDLLSLVDEYTGELLHESVAPDGYFRDEIAMTDSHVFLQSRNYTLAFDLVTGEEVWRVTDLGELAVGDGYVFLSDHAGIRAYSILIPEPTTIAQLLCVVALGVLCPHTRRIG